MAASREPEQLLALLQAAASELKATQAELNAARGDLEAERTKTKHLQSQVERLDGLLQAAKAGHEPIDVTRPVPAVASEQTSVSDWRRMATTVPAGTSNVVFSAERTSVGPVDEGLWQARHRGLEEDLARAKAKVEALTAELAQTVESLNKFRNGTVTGEESLQVVELSTQVEDLKKALETARADAAANDAKRAAEAEAASGELGKRVHQLEGELALLRQRRDDLNVELARVENDRKQARTRIAELEVEAGKARQTFDAELQQALAAERSHREKLVQTQAQLFNAEEAKRVEAESSRDKERDKHQATAQKLLETRSKLRDFETQVANMQTRITELDAKLLKAHEAARAELSLREVQWKAATAQLESKANDAQRKLDDASAELRHVERQYEQLHREMLTLLDQRDEARKELELLRGKKT